MSTPNPSAAQLDVGDEGSRLCYVEPGSPAPDLDPIDFLARAWREILGGIAGALDGGPSWVPAPLPRTSGTLVDGGVVLILDDGVGLARAVAADLQAMGHPVIRFRHGMGTSGVEGVNLLSSASVSALLERSRERGPITAIVDASPLRDRLTSPTPDGPKPRPKAPSLALLIHAAADDLRQSAASGGACVILATLADGSSLADPGVMPLVMGDDLGNVRHRRVEFDGRGDVEVCAADLVHEILADDPSPEVAYHEGIRMHRAGESGPPRPGPQAILLGAPDRKAWIALARALNAWIGDHPGTDLIDLGFTLHHQQPGFGFRVGLVASDLAELGIRLEDAAHRLGDPDRGRIDDPEGIYWNIDRDRPPSAIGAPSATGWLAHCLAERFAQGRSIRTELLYLGRTPRRLDLGQDDVPPGPAAEPEVREISPAQRVLASLRAIPDLHRKVVLALFEL